MALVPQRWGKRITAAQEAMAEVDARARQIEAAILELNAEHAALEHARQRIVANVAALHDAAGHPFELFLGGVLPGEIIDLCSEYAKISVCDVHKSMFSGLTSCIFDTRHILHEFAASPPLHYVTLLRLDFASLALCSFAKPEFTNILQSILHQLETRRFRAQNITRFKAGVTEATYAIALFRMSPRKFCLQLLFDARAVMQCFYLGP